MFCVNGILFNHESKFRGENFITRKVPKAVANIVWNKNTVLEVGTLKSKEIGSCRGLCRGNGNASIKKSSRFSCFN